MGIKKKTKKKMVKYLQKHPGMIGCSRCFEIFDDMELFRQHEKEKHEIKKNLTDEQIQ